MALPFIGTALASLTVVAVANIGRLLSLIGPRADAGLAVYGIAEDPQSALLSLLGILMGSVGGSMGRNAGEMKTLSSRKKGMSSDNFKSLGSTFKNDGLVRDITMTWRAKR